MTQIASTITEGYIWNLFMMESMPEGELTSEHRIVDFHSVYTVLRAFLDNLIVERGGKEVAASPALSRAPISIVCSLLYAFWFAPEHETSLVDRTHG